MLNPQVLEYIKNETAKGTPRDTIIKNLTVGGGWAFAEVEKHLIAFDQGTFPQSATVPVDPTSNFATGINTNIAEIQEPKNHIIKINTLIFLSMAVPLVFLPEQIGIALMPIMGLHAGIVFVGMIVEGMKGLITGKPSNAFEFLATFALMGIIGLGSCFLCLAVQGM